MPRWQKNVFSVLIGIGIIGSGIYAFRDKFVAWYTAFEQEQLQENKPPESVWQSEKDSSSSNKNESGSTGSGFIFATTLPETYDLKMDFHSQAPLLVWDAFHEDFCEEASILLVLHYFENKSVTNEAFDKELFTMYEKEIDIFGKWESTTTEELKTFIERYFTNYQVNILENITEEQIEKYVASDIPVLLPMSGRTIGNPFYKAPGPVYHILVIKGYTKTHFITNDVGTKRGKNFFYKKNVIMDNIHDWDAENIFHGAKRGFVILPR